MAQRSARDIGLAASSFMLLKDHSRENARNIKKKRPSVFHFWTAGVHRRHDKVECCPLNGRASHAHFYRSRIIKTYFLNIRNKSAREIMLDLALEEVGV